MTTKHTPKHDHDEKPKPKHVEKPSDDTPKAETVEEMHRRIESEAGGKR